MTDTRNISPALAQFAANECERLRKANAELVAALENAATQLHVAAYFNAEKRARAALARAKEEK